MLELLVVMSTLGVAAWAAGASVVRKSAAARALDRYAVARGLTYVPARTQRTSPRILGSKDGIPFVVDLYRLNDETRTRVTTDAPRGRAVVLSAAQRGAFDWKKAPTFELGEAELDRAYVVLTGTDEDGEALRDAKAPLLVLQALRHGIWLRSDGHRVVLSWGGTESDPVVLDAARDALVRIAARHRPTAPYR